MSIKRDYFYLPDTRSLVVLSEFFQTHYWEARPVYLISINTLDGILDLEFASKEGINLLLDALQELLNTDKKHISIKSFMPKDEDTLF